uniref:NADH-ubiquinone oxidoreductase chain 2 n=1 Tax=Orancistrocerus aterrimus TaxID=2485977 RepID=A0A3G3FXH6_9HYME|nr:NADH dehydrogenase subunit 2 [Orancistrocerus aterrimus]AYQ18919.1 NADH dehydrogenase subunit 2 [Orancistrocerus aterrimus]
MFQFFKKTYPYNNNKLCTFLGIMMFFTNILALQTNNLKFLWLLMEINTLMLIIILISVDSSKKYSLIFFSIQSFSSLIMIWTFMTMPPLNFFIYSLTCLSLNLKLGLFPFTWLPPLFTKNMNWFSIFLFSTSNKFIPFLIIGNLPDNTNNWFFLTCLITVIISTIKSLFHYNLKIMITYSSINNYCWMIPLIFIDNLMFLYFFLFYMIFLYIVMNMMYLINPTNHLSLKIYQELSSNNYFLLFLTLGTMNLSMIPPMSSFLIKTFSMMLIIKLDSFSLLFILILFSTISIIMYFNFFAKLLIFSSFKFNFLIKQPPMKHYPLIILIFSLLSSTSLIMIILI